jgi:HD-GYP domain-containing protein (c-di-GMP phosphodiesterase class II)
MGTPDAILNKEGPLTDEERRIIQKHPLDAYQMMKRISYLYPAMDIPYCHHERWDGTGYPRGLKGKEIPISARIFLIVDVWDAMTNDRPYRKAIPQDDVIKYLRSESGKLFDPQILEVFIRIVKPGA